MKKVSKKQWNDVIKQTEKWLKDKDPRGQDMLNFADYLWWKKHVRPFLDSLAMRIYTRIGLQ